MMQIAKVYLPNIAGYRHTWDCILNGKNVAIIRGNCKEITFNTDTLTLSDLSSLYFMYHSATY